MLRRLRNGPLSVCVGPKGSGTQLVMKALLGKAGIGLDEPVHASVAEMLTRLSSPDDLRVGCMMSHAPSALIAALLDDPAIRLLSLGPRIRQRLVYDLVAFEPATIEGSVYGVEEEPAIKTISTTSVLVANEHVEDVRGNHCTEVALGAGETVVVEAAAVRVLSNLELLRGVGGDPDDVHRLHSTISHLQYEPMQLGNYRGAALEFFPRTHLFFPGAEGEMLSLGLDLPGFGLPRNLGDLQNPRRLRFSLELRF